MMKFSRFSLHVYPFYPLSVQLLQSLFLYSWNNVCANDFFSQEKSLVWRSQIFLVWQTFIAMDYWVLNRAFEVIYLVWYDFYCWKTEDSLNVYTTFRWFSLSYHHLNFCFKLTLIFLLCFQLLQKMDEMELMWKRLPWEGGIY